MHQVIENVYQFRDSFHQAGRGNQFSYEGLEVLFDWLEEVNPDYELDVIGLCCEFSEDSVEEIARYYEIPLDGLSEEDAFDQVMNFLEESTSVCGKTSEGSIVYQQF